MYISCDFPSANLPARTLAATYNESEIEEEFHNSGLTASRRCQRFGTSTSNRYNKRATQVATLCDNLIVGCWLMDERTKAKRKQCIWVNESA